MPAYLIEPKMPEAGGYRRKASPRVRSIQPMALASAAVVAMVVAACSAGGGSHAPASEKPTAASPTLGRSPEAAPTIVPSTPRPSLAPDVTLFAPAPAVAIADASTEFDDPAELDGWRVSQGEAMDGGSTTFTIEDGVLRVVAAQSEWIDREHGPSAGRTIEGNVLVTIRVRAAGAAGGLPLVPWSLAGMMLRAPTTDPAVENWVHWTAGALGDWTLERKETRGGRSELKLIRVPAGWVELRILRHGSSVVLLHRSDGAEWTVDHAYYRPDLPPAVELLLTAQTGGESDRGDLVATFDWLHVAASPVSAAIGEALAGGHAVEPEALLAELGD
jgi:hypothetical protein